MNGIILAGGAGSRLWPVTKSVSKQILPVYDKPMIYYSLSCLMLAGIRDVLFISSTRDLKLFRELFGDGAWLGMHFEYAEQTEPRGIADAFLIGKDFIGGDEVALVLGDNIFYGQNFSSILKGAVRAVSEGKGAFIFGYYISTPEAYGVLELDDVGKVLSIQEKPEVPKSNYAVPGLYFYDNQVIDIAASLKPSLRGELEITDINNFYLRNDRLMVQLLGRGMTWFDTGTCDGLLEASNFVASIQNRQGFYVSCIEEIAYNNGWISKNQLLDMAKEYKTEYGLYLEFIAGM